MYHAKSKEMKNGVYFLLFCNMYKYISTTFPQSANLHGLGKTDKPIV